MPPLADQIDLEQYVRTDSREALDRLARRHVDFVYGVARREVHDPHLAEDVVQAVFLILSKRAAKIRPASLAGWLFRTTRHVAANARKAAARREFHERRAAEIKTEHVMAADPIESEPLHAALSAQNQNDRSIVLMRYVQGLEVREIAEALGLNEIAARKRLERAIERLRRYMTRRGVTVESAAVGAAMGQIAQAAPSHLTLLKAGAGAQSLAKVTLSAMTLLPLKIAAAVFLVVGLTTAVGVTIERHVATTSTVAMVIAPATQPAIAPAAAADNITYTGVVTDPSGQPAASVHVCSEISSEDPAKAKAIEAETTTDSQGKYALANLPAIKPNRYGDTWIERELHFDQPQYAMAWKSLNENDIPDPGEPLQESVQLEQSKELRVLVNDSAGKPIANAQVWLWLQHGLNPAKVKLSYGYLTLPQGDGLKTDTEGVVTFTRIPENARGHVIVKHPDFVKFSSEENYHNDNFPVRPGGDPFVATLVPGGKICVHLTGAAAGLHRAEVIAQPVSKENLFPAYTNATFDPDGTYLLTSVRPGVYDVNILAKSEKLDGLFSPVLSVNVAAGATADVSPVLSKGQWISGRVIDPRTKMPVPGQGVYAAFAESGRQISTGDTTTDKDGKFSLRVLPGACLLMCDSWQDREYTQVKKNLTVPPDAPLNVGAIEAQPIDKIRGRLVDSSGKAVAGKVMTWADKTDTAADGSFALQVRSGGRDEKILFYAFSRDKSLGKAILDDNTYTDPKLAGGGELPAIVLEPISSVAGRIVDKAGQAVADNKIELTIETGDGNSIGTYSPAWGGFENKNGTFTYQIMPIGLSMAVQIDGLGTQKIVALKDLQPGEHRDLGNIVLAPTVRGKGKQQAPADYSGTVAGTIVDPDGKPVAGVRVGGVLTQQGNSFDPSYDFSDQTGHFLLKNLPVGQRVTIFVSADIYEEATLTTTVGREDVKINLKLFGADLIGKPASEFDVAQWINSPPIKLADLWGKVVVLHLGVDFSRGYESNYQELFDAAKKYNGKDVVFVAIHHVPGKTPFGNETPDQIADYVKSHKIPFEVAIDKQTQANYHIQFGAAILVIDKNGTIRAVMRRGDPSREIDKLLAE